MKANKKYFIDSPLKVIFIIVIWWLLWISIANIRTRYYPPDLVNISVFLYIIGLIIPLFFFESLIFNKKRINRPLVLPQTINYPFFYIQVAFLIFFLVFICLPRMRENFFSYRMNIYWDNDKGIKSIIYPSPFFQLLFEIVFFQLANCFLLIATFTGNKKLFKRAAIILVLFSIISLSRGLYLTILLFYLLQPHIKYKLIKFCVLIISLMVLIPDYIEYNTIGFSLLEKFIHEHNLFDPFTYRSGRISSLGGFLWPVYSLTRIFIPSFFTGFEEMTKSNSSFVDIGRQEEIYYNAFYTHLISPIYDLGFLGPFILGLVTAILIIWFSQIKNIHISRIFIGELFYISMSGNTMNFLCDKMILPLIITTIILYRSVVIKSRHQTKKTIYKVEN